MRLNWHQDVMALLNYRYDYARNCQNSLVEPQDPKPAWPGSNQPLTMTTQLALAGVDEEGGLHTVDGDLDSAGVSGRCGHPWVQ